MNKTLKKGNKDRRKTIKKRENRIKRNAYIVHRFLGILNTVKLYHWKTTSYAAHKATDELYERLNKNMDIFVEVLIGKENKRIKMVEKNLRLIDKENTSEIKEYIHEIREFLINLDEMFQKKDSDLLSIRDDLLVDINQFLYLITFDK
jgi:DNA-binding ferritin-like protein